MTVFLGFFPPPSKSPSQVLPVHTSASAPAFKAITWTRNHLHTIGKSCPKQKKEKSPAKLIVFPPLPPSLISLEMQLYRALNSALGLW